MPTSPQFACPIIIKLEKEFGSKCDQKDISFRESRDVDVFLRAKEKTEKKSLKIKKIFQAGNV